MLTPTRQVQAGDLLDSDAFNSHGVLIVAAGTELTSVDIDKLQRHGIDWVELRQPEETGSAADEEPLDELSPQEQQRQQAAVAAYKEAVDGIKSLFEQAESLGTITPESVDSGFNPLVDQVHQEKDLVSLLLVLNSRDDYTYQHSVQVGMISYYISKWLGQDEPQALLAGKAGYLHDIGKCKIEREILQKPGKLTPEEYDRIKKHTLYGYDMLKKSGFPESLSLPALQHHERMNGTGYPLALQSQALHPISKIVAVADIYSAMISTRVYQKKRDLLFVLREIHRSSFGEIDPHIAQVFIRRMIPNFIGKRVLLTSGESGLIVMTNPCDFFRPLIRLNDNFIDMADRPDLEVEHILV